MEETHVGRPGVRGVYRCAASGGPSSVKVGIVGLGQVGQAVARLAPSATRLHDSGLRFKVVGALVRDVDKPRRCARPRLTSNPAAFLRGNYDVVIEALGTIEPARSIVSRVLGRGDAGRDRQQSARGRAWSRVELAGGAARDDVSL